MADAVLAGIQSQVDAGVMGARAAERGIDTGWPPVQLRGAG